MDTENDDPFVPIDSNLYLYAGANPVDKIDPSGNDEIAEVSMANAVMVTLATMATIAALQVLQNVKYDLPIRANHYTSWTSLTKIMAGGIDNPNGDNYFTPDYYFSGSTAKSSLALSKTPQCDINLTLYPFRDGLKLPTTVLPLNGEPGGGTEYVTTQAIPFWSRAPVVWPLF